MVMQEKYYPWIDCHFLQSKGRDSTNQIVSQDIVQTTSLLFSNLSKSHSILTAANRELSYCPCTLR